mmetsp:Transcript_40797/g.61790  ORF Transcript_40797/g.61790 Transcript_40797/m.61790 type:complete len:121 (-) Transcript_40797:224-586(-)
MAQHQPAHIYVVEAHYKNRKMLSSRNFRRAASCAIRNQLDDNYFLFPKMNLHLSFCMRFQGASFFCLNDCMPLGCASIEVKSCEIWRVWGGLLFSPLYALCGIVKGCVALMPVVEDNKNL